MTDLETLKTLLKYHSKYGSFRWRIGRGCARRGQIAGTIDKLGYVVIRVSGKSYFAHRLVWLFETGEWPASSLDHRDCDKSNNKFNNLRLATQAENCRNTPRRGQYLKGVSRQEYGWISQIMIDGKSRYLGFFKSETAAHAAYRAAAKELHGEFARAE